MIAHLAGIRVFATGGIGGVHRGAEITGDISADLDAIAGLEIVAGDGLAVDPRAVAARQVPAPESAVLGTDLQVTARRRKVPDDELTAHIPSDQQSRADGKSATVITAVGTKSTEPVTMLFDVICYLKHNKQIFIFCKY